MTAFELRERKMELIRLMLEVYSKDFVFGWLQSAYVYPDGAYEEEILERTFKETLEIKEKKEKEMKGLA